MAKILDFSISFDVVVGDLVELNWMRQDELSDGLGSLFVLPWRQYTDETTPEALPATFGDNGILAAAYQAVRRGPGRWKYSNLMFDSSL